MARGRSDTGELSLQAREPGLGRRANALVVRYLTKAAIKLPSAGDNAQQRSTPVVICLLLSWCIGQDGVTVVHSRVHDGIGERGQ